MRRNCSPSDSSSSRALSDQMETFDRNYFASCTDSPLGALLTAMLHIGKETQRRHGAKESGLRWGKPATRVRCDARPMAQHRTSRRACPGSRFAAIKLIPSGRTVLSPPPARKSLPVLYHGPPAGESCRDRLGTLGIRRKALTAGASGVFSGRPKRAVLQQFSGSLCSRSFAPAEGSTRLLRTT